MGPGLKSIAFIGLSGAILAPPASWLAAGGDLRLLPSPLQLQDCPDIAVDDANFLTPLNSWQIRSATPPKRYHPGFAFDETHGHALVFAGVDAAGNVLGDTWIMLANGEWRASNAAGSPKARAGHALAWAGARFLLFGGNGLNETWTYDSIADTWTYVQTTGSPPGNLFFPAMAYDSNRSKAVLFGGSAGASTWIFDTQTNTWNAVNPTPAPTGRIGAGMAYDKSQQKIILFGGQDPLTQNYLSDTWGFSLANNTWAELTPSSAPKARAYAGLAYNTRQAQIVLFGGRSSEIFEDLHYYDGGENQWREIVNFTDTNRPFRRYAHGLSYDTGNDLTLAFGGLVDGSPVNALWAHQLRSSGSCVAATTNISTTTPLSWKTFAADFQVKPQGTDVLFQLASSGNGKNYDEFRGPDGSSTTFYTNAATPIAIWSGHDNRQYLKIKSVFISTNPPENPFVAAFNISYNRAPEKVTLISPSSGARLNTLTPTFLWNVANDPDGVGDHPLSYRLEMARNENFSDTLLVQTAVTAGLFEASRTVTSGLNQGLWHWRVRPADNEGLAGSWSETYALLLDTTTPPAAVNSITALMGPGNGEITLKWIFPGDDKGAVHGGRLRVRYSRAGPINTEALWSQAEGEKTADLQAEAQQMLATVITNLQAASTYFFAIKTEDELGNLSALSSTSPFMLTNAPPTVELKKPTGGETLGQTVAINWIGYDSNPGDTWSGSVLLSSNSGNSFNILIAGNLASSTTFYLWDSRAWPNGSNYRIKIVLTDLAGSAAEAISPANFTLDNANEPPTVEFIKAPGAKEKILSPYELSWSVADPNGSDTHTHTLLLSDDGGKQFAYILATALTQTKYTLDPGFLAQQWNLGNLSSYRLKIITRDSGNPTLSDEVLSSIFAIATQAQSRFVLLKPLSQDFPTVFNLVFAWEKPAVLYDPITYTLQYTTAPAFNIALSSAVTAQTQYKPALGALLWNQTYYWQLTAQDGSGRESVSDTAQFMLSRRRAKSPDQGVEVELLSNLPEDVFLDISDAQATHSNLIAMAEQDAKADPLIKTIAAAVWHIRLKNLNESISGVASLTWNPQLELDSTQNLGILPSQKSSTVPPARSHFFVSSKYPSFESRSNAPTGDSRLNAKITAHYNDGFVDAGIIDPGRLRLAHLNENKNRWEIAAQQQEIDRINKTVSASVNELSLFTVVAAASLPGTLSQLSSFPNPFAAGQEQTHFRYVLTENADITIRIYTLTGDLVRELQFMAGGKGGLGAPNGFTNEVSWDGKNGAGRVVANGMYITQIVGETTAGRWEEKRLIGVLK